MKISNAQLYTLLQSHICASDDDDRPFLATVKFEFADTEIRSVATNGHVLSIITVPYSLESDDWLDTPAVPEPWLLVARDCKEVAKRIKPRGQNQIDWSLKLVALDDRINVFDTLDMLIGTIRRRTEQDFPPYEKVIPDVDASEAPHEFVGLTTYYLALSQKLAEAVGTLSVAMQTRAPLDPIRIEGKGKRGKFLYVVMPVRL